MESITVFTPTYNRGNIIKRLYCSLKKQTCKDFVWLVVDDGSTDSTEKLIKKWQLENEIKIEYLKQDNLGKSMAHNKAVEMTTTEIFMCLDSNDVITPNAIEMVLKCWEKVKLNENIVGIMSQKKVQFKDIKREMKVKQLPGYIKIKHDKKPGGKAFNDRYYIAKEKANDGYVETTLGEAYRKFGLKGEAMLVFRTTEVKKYQFPKIQKEKFVPEAYLYNLIDRDGKLVVLNRTLCVHRYQMDGYTFNMSKLIKDNPKGYLLYVNQKINSDYTFRSLFFDYIRYISVAGIAGEKDVIKKAHNKIVALMAYPFGVIFYLLRYKRV